MSSSRDHPRSLPSCSDSWQVPVSTGSRAIGGQTGAALADCSMCAERAMRLHPGQQVLLPTVLACLQWSASFQHHPATEQHCVSSRHSLLPTLPPPQVPLLGLPWHGPPTQFSGLPNGRRRFCRAGMRCLRPACQAGAGCDCQCLLPSGSLQGLSSVLGSSPAGTGAAQQLVPAVVKVIPTPASPRTAVHGVGAGFVAHKPAAAEGHRLGRAADQRGSLPAAWADMPH